MPRRSNEKKRSALKGRFGRFGGIVYIVEDSNGEAVEPIPNEKKRRPKVE